MKHIFHIKNAKIFHAVLRVGWVAIIAFLIPRFASGNDCAKGPNALAAATQNARSYFPQKCEEAASQKAKKLEAADTAKQNSEKITKFLEEEKRACNSFASEISNSESQLQAEQGKLCSLAEQVSMQRAKIQADPKVSFEDCQRGIVDAQKLTNYQTNLEAAALTRLKTIQFKVEENQESQANALNTLAQATGLKSISGNIIGTEIKGTCALKGTDLDDINRKNAETRQGADDMGKAMQGIQGIAQTVGQMAQTIAGMQKGNEQQGQQNAQMPSLTSPDLNTPNVTAPFDVASNNGINGPQPTALAPVETGNGVGLEVGGAPTNTVVASTEGTTGGTLPAISGFTDTPANTFGLGNTANGDVGIGSVASAGGIGSSAQNLSGASRDPGSAGANAANAAAAAAGAGVAGDNGEDRSGGGGKFGSGSSLLGLSSGDTGLGDLMGGLKTPEAEAGAGAGASSIQLASAEPPAVEERLARAVELNVASIPKDWIFSAVKDCIHRQRELGNTR